MKGVIDVKLYDFLIWNPDRYDTGDTRFMGIVPVCATRSDNYDIYDRFLDGLFQLVDVVERVPEAGRANNPDPIVNWSEFLHENRDLVYPFAKRQWNMIVDEDDEEDVMTMEYFMYERLASLISGKGTKSEYTLFCMEIIEPVKKREAEKLKKFTVKLIPPAFTVEIEAQNADEARKLAEDMEYSEEMLCSMVLDSIGSGSLRVIDAFIQS